MKKSTSTALFLSPAFFLGLMSLLWVYWLNPFVRSWILNKIPEINDSQPYVTFSVEDLDLSILKLQARAKNTTIEFKKAAVFNGAELNQIHTDTIKAQIDIFSLMVGQLSISNISIEGLSSDQKLAELIKLNNPNSPEIKNIDLKPVFELIDKIPVKKISLLNSELQTEVDSSFHNTLRKIKTHVKLLNLGLNRNSITIDTQQFETVLTNHIQASINLFLNLKLKLTAKSYDLDQFQITQGQSEAKITSSSNDLVQLLTHPKTSLDFSFNIKLDEIRNLIYIFTEQTRRLPQVSGFIKTSGSITTDGLKKNKGSVKVNTEEVRFENLKFGNAKAVAQVQDSHVLVDSVLVEHPSGRAELKQISIQHGKPFSFKTNVIVENFQLQKLFGSLNLANIPADFQADAKADCSGQIENFKLHCESISINAENIDVKADIKDSFHIVQVDKAKATGEIDMNSKEIKYTSELQIGSSVAHSTGTVDFQNGFDLEFKSKAFKFDEINNIAGLGLKGIASGDLKTQGTSSFGTIDSNLNIQNLIIDHFSLGQVQTQLKYKEGQLSFLNNTAQLNKTQYQGSVILDFIKSSINGEFQMKTLFIEDILTAIENRWHLPLKGLGKGFGEIQFSGPLDFWRMKYTLKSEFNRGHIMDESFTKLDFNLNSDGEKIDFKNVTLHKTNGTIQISNDIVTMPANQTPNFDLQIRSRNLKFEDIDHFSKFFPNTNGTLILNGVITSNILSPQIDMQTQIKDLKIETLSLPTSQGQVKLNLDRFQFVGQIFGRQLQLDLNVPFSNKDKFSIKAQARDFNPLVLLPLISLPLPPNDTYATVSGDVDLSADTLRLQKLTGSIQVDNVLLQRSSQFLKLKKPSTLIFNKGLQKMTPLELVGSEQNLRVMLKNGSSSDLMIDGRIFLRPLQFLVPFSDNLSGIAEISCLLDLSADRLSLNGEGLIDSASFSMKGFKYPINDITAYFDFSKSKIIFSEINATLNQSEITGQGQIDIKGPQNVEVQLSAETEKIDLEFPKQYQTSGIAQIQFYGKWLPYHLKINYAIDEGQITNEFTEDDENATLSLRPSPFLPAQQLSQKNQSLILDVNADFSKGVFIKNRIIEGIATGQIHVSGSPENPILQGRVDIQQGSRLIFKDKPFDIQLGYVVFNGEYVINPNIFINANARVSDYDINLLIQGPAKNLDIRPSSQPSLTREDIFSLLTLGYTASKNDQTLSSDAQQKQTGLEVLAALSNQSQFNKKLQEKLGLNVQLSPSIDSTRNIAVPKVTVSKKLSPKVTTSYSRPLTGDQQENEVRLQYLWTKDWSLILNYQNQNSDQQTNILQSDKTETGVGGIDLEFKKEFGE